MIHKTQLTNKVTFKNCVRQHSDYICPTWTCSEICEGKSFIPHAEFIIAWISIEIKVQGFFICHIINYTGYNQKWNDWILPADTLQVAVNVFAPSVTLVNFWQDFIAPVFVLNIVTMYETHPMQDTVKPSSFLMVTWTRCEICFGICPPHTKTK